VRKLARDVCPAALVASARLELAAARVHFVDEKRRAGFKFKAYKHDDVKASLSKMSSGKCAYCEADYDATQPVDVEHYRPKGAVDTETGQLKPGYWWLAPAWDNLLPSCIRCNREEGLIMYDGTELKTGKANRFPLLHENKRAKAIGEEAYEDPLLIDPCREDPSQYIKFVENDGRCIAVAVDGDPKSRSAQRARASIDIYGLNRGGLVRDRSRYMQWAKLSLARLDQLARRLERLAPGAAQDRKEIADAINKELQYLDGLTFGEDRYTGMLVAIVDPALAALNISL
jgi:uncharacterized protein (TIGR02646 family)